MAKWQSVCLPLALRMRRDNQVMSGLRALGALILLTGVFACTRAPSPDLSVILADKPAQNLSDYGLFLDPSAQKPAAGVVAYDLINPLFSDYAEKTRYVFVPDGQSVVYTAQDVLDFPVGTVLVKTFSYADRALETRLLIHKADGWEAIPYVWAETDKNAVYAPVGKRLEIAAGVASPEAPAFTYAVPNKNQCKTCHQHGDAVIPIGPKARNLNHQGPYGANQLVDWQSRGLLMGLPLNPTQLPYVSDSAANLDARARAYLDINCAHCHKSTGSASNSGLWLDWTESDSVRLGYGKHPTAAGRGSGQALYVIKPGAPEESIMVYRMASTEAGVAMPELGRALPDTAGVALISDWIANHSEPDKKLTD